MAILSRTSPHNQPALVSTPQRSSHLAASFWWPRTRLPCSSEGKEPACNAGDQGSAPGLGRSPGEGNGNTLLAWRMPWTKGGVWQDTIHGITKSWTPLTSTPQISYCPSTLSGWAPPGQVSPTLQSGSLLTTPSWQPWTRQAPLQSGSHTRSILRPPVHPPAAPQNKGHPAHMGDTSGAPGASNQEGLLSQAPAFYIRPLL